MTIRIAVAGKGGTGKTTLSALLIRYLIETKPGKSILAVDADANANLNEALALKYWKLSAPFWKIPRNQTQCRPE
jgi:CO dehydrogenase maturation factor